MRACTDQLRRSPSYPVIVPCLGFGAHEIHSGRDTDGKWILWKRDGKIFTEPVDSGQSQA